MDYGQFTDKIDNGGEVNENADDVEEDTSEAKTSVIMMVMQECLKSSIWAYQVDRKGAAEEWIAPQVLHDLETIDEYVVIKSDQEPSVAEVLRDVARQRKADYGTAIGESMVGESKMYNCNAGL